MIFLSSLLTDPKVLRSDGSTSFKLLSDAPVTQTSPKPEPSLMRTAVPACQIGASLDLDSLTFLDKVAAKRGTAAHPFLA